MGNSNIFKRRKIKLFRKDRKRNTKNQSLEDTRENH